MHSSDKLLNIVTYVLGFAFLVIITVMLGKQDLGDVDILAFIGALLGGAITLVGVIFTIRGSFEGLKEQAEYDRNKTIEANRSYISVQEFNGAFQLHNLETSYKSRIILTEHYNIFVENNTQQELKGTKTTFYKISIHGIPEIIVNCKIKITLETKGGVRHIINSRVGLIEKNEEVFIPIYRLGEETVNALKTEVEYSTLSDERIYYLYDVENMKEGYWKIDGNDRKLIFTFDLENSSWFYPNRIKDNNERQKNGSKMAE